MSGARATARAIDALRRGWPVAVREGALRLVVLAVETADAGRLRGFDPNETADILISASRAQTLKMINQADAAQPDMPVLIARAPWIDLAVAMSISDPALDLATPLKGPFRSKGLHAAGAARAAMELARLAGLLPAFFVSADHDANAELDLFADALIEFSDSRLLKIAARARLPVAACDSAEIVAFRSDADATEHIALILGVPDGRPPLVRLHSECLTGDVLSSLKCDCGPQLDAALARIATEWGILLYLRQEGRGIGLINKLRAYTLQDQGFDTVDANVRLGFAADARDFGIGAEMLRLVGQDRIRLLTNNPDKVAQLEAHSIKVVERVPHSLPANPHNARYLATKRDRSGHHL